VNPKSWAEPYNPIHCEATIAAFKARDLGLRSADRVGELRLGEPGFLSEGPQDRHGRHGDLQQRGVSPYMPSWYNFFKGAEVGCACQRIPKRHIPEGMTLDEYLRANGIKEEAFATDAKVSQAAISRYRTGKRKPRADVMQRIIFASRGAVQANDFFEIPPQAAE